MSRLELQRSDKCCFGPYYFDAHSFTASSRVQRLLREQFLTVEDVSRTFAELNALITQPSLAKQLERELTLFASQSERVCSRDADALRYAEPRATIEEWLG